MFARGGPDMCAAPDVFAAPEVFESKMDVMSHIALIYFLFISKHNSGAVKQAALM